METNQKSHSTKNVCEKIYRAITVGSPIRTLHRISFRQHETSPAKVPKLSLPISSPAIAATKPVEGVKQLRPKTKQASEAAVPVKIGYKTPPVSNLRRGIHVTEVASNIETPTSVQDKHKSNRPRPEKIAPAQVIREEKPGEHIEDRFTEYINRTKLKMRSMSNVGEEKSSAVLVVDVGNKDHFSEYVRRAKQSLRTNSSLKVSSESFKGEGKRGP